VKRILAIDRDPGVRERLVATLCSGEREIWTVTHVEEALRLIRDFHFDLIVAGLAFTGELSAMDLVDLLEREFPDVPCIVMSERPITASVAGMCLTRARVVRKVIDKPFDRQSVVEAVDNALA
jgi:DNA-binding NtrC family response regulator